MTKAKANLNLHGFKWPKNIRSYYNSLKTVLITLERIFNGQNLEPDTYDFDEDLVSL